MNWITETKTSSNHCLLKEDSTNDVPSDTNQAAEPSTDRGSGTETTTSPNAPSQAVRAGPGEDGHGALFTMLDPRNMARNPVMFLVEAGWILTTLVMIESIVNGAATGLIVYQGALAILLLLTVLFANFAEALAEARERPRRRAYGLRVKTPSPIGSRRPARASRSPQPRSRQATAWWWRLVRLFRPTAISSRAWLRSTNPRLQAKAHR